MSMREEDRQKNNCPSRGLGLAAAAIGVGVGAALYYFFSKRPENPDGEGSTSGWSCEQPHAFNLYDEESDTSIENQCINISDPSMEDSEYTTISEGTTTDTSVHNSYEQSSEDSESDEDSYIDVIPQEANEQDFYNIEDFVTSYDEDLYESAANLESEEWDVTDSSLDIPEQRQPLRELSPLRVMMSDFGALFSPLVPRVNRRNHATRDQEQRDLLRAQALSEEEQIKYLKAQRFRERSWSLEECSVCFEIMLRDQQLSSLPCAHRFHAECLAPWLAEQRTCPNCRKAVE